MPSAQRSPRGELGSPGRRRAEGASFAIALVVLLGATQARLPLPGAAGGSDDAPAPCTVELQPDTLTVRERPARILVRLPRDVGEPRGVDVSPESGLDVREVRPDPDGRTWIVGLYLGDAVPGTWTLRFRGSDGDCEGELTTRMPGGDRPPGPPPLDAGDPRRLGHLAGVARR